MNATGKNTGIVVDIGENSHICVPVSNGFVLSQMGTKTGPAGRSLTLNLMQELNKQHSLEGINGKLDAQSAKEALFFIPENKINLTNKTFEVDKKIFNVNNLCYNCPEVLFSENHGIHNNIKTSIMNCDSSIRSELSKNIILTGGTTFIKGFKERLERELKSIGIAPGFYSCDDTTRMNLAWIGGSMMAQNQNLYISSAEFSEWGVVALNEKCIWG